MTKKDQEWNRAVDEHRDAVRQIRAECDELIEFHDKICELIDEWYGKVSDYREDLPIHNPAFWIDLAEKRFSRFNREPAFIANYLWLEVKERRSRKVEVRRHKLH
jgi:hypothetical protein